MPGKRGRKPGTMVRQTCTDHCSSCGGHFHGLGAFDAHLPVCKDGNFQEARNGKGRQMLQPWTLEGFCSLASGSFKDGEFIRWEHPVTIWQLIPTEGASEFFSKKRGLNG